MCRQNKFLYFRVFKIHRIFFSPQKAISNVNINVARIRGILGRTSREKDIPTPPQADLMYRQIFNRRG